MRDMEPRQWLLLAYDNAPAGTRVELRDIAERLSATQT